MILASIGCGYLSNATTSAFQYSSPFMTIQFCLEVCKGEGLNIAFIRGELCQCEMSTEKLQMLPQHFCSNESSCPGNPLQTCGIQEKNIFSVYEAVAPTFSNSQITGRYLFSITIRAFKNLLMRRNDNNFFYHKTDSNDDKPTKIKWIQGKKYFLKGPKGKFQVHIVDEFVSKITLDVDSGDLTQTKFSPSRGLSSENPSVIMNNKVIVSLAPWLR